MEKPADLLVNQLSKNLANLIVDHLEKESISEQLVIVDLFYHYADWYLPLVSYTTIVRLEEILRSESFYLYEQKQGPIYLDPKPLDTQMDQLWELEYEEFCRSGRIMVRKTAAILNQTKLLGRLATHELFGAYAADGTVEGHSSEDWEKILTACGVSPEKQAAWKRLGFF